MIPYDDLVHALQQWRAKQGLPVHAAVAFPAAPSPGSGPARTAPPMAPPPARAPSVVEPLEEAAEYVDEGAYEAAEEAVEAGGAYQARPDAEVEPTAIGAIPGPDDELDGQRRDDSQEW